MLKKFKYFLGTLLLIIFFINISCSEKRNNDLERQVEEKKFSDTVGLALSAHMYYESNRYLEALKDYSLLIKYDSLNGKNYYRRAYSLAQLNRLEESVPDFIKAAELGYKPCKAYYSLAVMYSTVFLNDSLALHYCKECLKIDPESKDVKRLLGQLKRKNVSI